MNVVAVIRLDAKILDNSVAQDTLKELNTVIANKNSTVIIHAFTEQTSEPSTLATIRASCPNLSIVQLSHNKAKMSEVVTVVPKARSRDCCYEPFEITTLQRGCAQIADKLYPNNRESSVPRSSL